MEKANTENPGISSDIFGTGTFEKNINISVLHCSITPLLRKWFAAMTRLNDHVWLTVIPCFHVRNE